MPPKALPIGAAWTLQIDDFQDVIPRGASTAPFFAGIRPGTLDYTDVALRPGAGTPPNLGLDGRSPATRDRGKAPQLTLWGPTANLPCLCKFCEGMCASLNIERGPNAIDSVLPYKEVSVDGNTAASFAECRAGNVSAAVKLEDR